MDRVDMTDVTFVSPSSESGKVKVLIEAVAREIQNIPTIQYGVNRNNYFNISIGSDSGITVKAGAIELYPVPQGDWAN